MPGSLGKEAVVVGAGMGGLAAAKALSAHFDRVTVLDRDALPQGPEPRQGTPQARHAHVLLAGGQEALADLFPGIAKDLERAGAVRTRMGLDLRFERLGYDPFPARDLGIATLCMSRPLLEFVARQHLERQSNIALRPRCRVRELVTSADRAAVAAVRYDNAEGQDETLRADLVVDASGRAALTLGFLTSIGGEKPDETEIGIDQAYASAIFDIPDDAPADWTGVTHLPSAPHSSRGAFIFPLENRRWIVSLGGNHGDEPPGEIEGFLAFAKSLRTATIYDAIKGAKRQGEISRFALPASIRRHFERLRHFPRGLIPVADSLCRFNPVFGQGMSVAAQEARVLGRLLAERASLREPLDGLAPAFFAEIQPLLAAPWATAETDFVYPKTRGDCPPDLGKRLQYAVALTRLAAADPDVHRLVAEVNNLVRPQSAFRDPQLAARVTELMTASAKT